MKNFTEIVCVLDRSGSMDTIKDDAIGGFNTFLKAQQETPGEAKMSVILFDDKYELLYKSKALMDIPLLNSQTFVPRGSTALFDALVKTIQEVGVGLAALVEAERPNKVLFVILTDGQENASTNYTRRQINEMITHQRNVYQWEFLFLAANQDAFAVSEGLGIARGNSLNFHATSEGTHRMYRMMNLATTKYRLMDLDGDSDGDNERRANLFADGLNEQEEEEKPI